MAESQRNAVVACQLRSSIMSFYKLLFCQNVKITVNGGCAVMKLVHQKFDSYIFVSGDNFENLIKSFFLQHGNNPFYMIIHENLPRLCTCVDIF